MTCFTQDMRVKTNDYWWGVADPSPVGSNITTLFTHPNVYRPGPAHIHTPRTQVKEITCNPARTQAHCIIAYRNNESVKRFTFLSLLSQHPCVVEGETTHHRGDESLHIHPIYTDLSTAI